MGCVVFQRLCWEQHLRLHRACIVGMQSQGQDDLVVVALLREHSRKLHETAFDHLWVIKVDFALCVFEHQADCSARCKVDQRFSVLSSRFPPRIRSLASRQRACSFGKSSLAPRHTLLQTFQERLFRSSGKSDRIPPDLFGLVSNGFYDQL
jgi:hypothetical protein